MDDQYSYVWHIKYSDPTVRFSTPKLRDYKGMSHTYICILVKCGQCSLRKTSKFNMQALKLYKAKGNEGSDYLNAFDFMNLVCIH